MTLKNIANFIVYIFTNFLACVFILVALILLVFGAWEYALLSFVLGAGAIWLSTFTK